MAKNSKSFL